jgi:CheY-like chemotaxis protein
LTRCSIEALSHTVPTVAQILLIEDHPDTREIFRTILEVSGHEVLEAGDGLTGLELAVEHEPDLVVLDLGLPGMDGWSVLGAIRDDPCRDHVRVLIVTAHGDQETTERMRRATCNGLLVKPVVPRKLAQSVDRCLAGEDIGAGPGTDPPGRG